VTAGYCSLPTAAQAVSVNVTLWPAPGTQVQWITLWPAGQTQPSVSTINDYQGTMYNAANGITMYGINNAAIVPLGTGGAFDIYVTDTTNLFIDVNGYYAAIGDTYGNTALGIGALVNNIPSEGGGSNTADGYDTLTANTTGFGNTAVGSGALYSNATGIDNAASGAAALQSNTTGSFNTASGYRALLSNTTGRGNTASGYGALLSNTTGIENTATGNFALFLGTTGSNNIALGYQAGYNLTTGSNNIYIGSQGDSSGVESNVTYLGTQGTQTTTYIAGIYNTTTGASGALPVVVDSNGQLGTTSSSRTVKRDIEDMGDTTGTLMSLRPVTFRYKLYGPDSPLQYGLVAEEVAEVAPELVARNKDGKIETVFYDKVNAMLLNQVQTLQRLADAQNEAIRRLESRLAELENRAK
jgi:hypothetical protein